MNSSVALARLDGRTCRLLDRSPLRELVGLERLAELECNEAERAARRRHKAKAKFQAASLGAPKRCAGRAGRGRPPQLTQARRP